MQDDKNITKNTKEKDVNDNKKLDKISNQQDKPESKSKWT